MSIEEDCSRRLNSLLGNGDTEMHDRLASRLWLAVRVSSRTMRASSKEVSLHSHGQKCILEGLPAFPPVDHPQIELNRPKVRCTCALCTRFSKRSNIFDALDKIQPLAPSTRSNLWNPGTFSLADVKKRAKRSTKGRHHFAAPPSQGAGEACDNSDEDQAPIELSLNTIASPGRQGRSLMSLKSIVARKRDLPAPSSGSSMTALDTLQKRLSLGTTSGGILCMHPARPPTTILTTDPSEPALILPPLVRRGAFAWRAAAGKARAALPPPNAGAEHGHDGTGDQRSALQAGSSRGAAAWRVVAAKVRTAAPPQGGGSFQSAGALRPICMVEDEDEGILGKLGGRSKSIS
ncbi:hypothetical protein T484DRAFT_1750778 [Baffinella frigidus]|nr:hypothetical protein T484DRAFT_1750778 [Cryptophyta sp. CCMP2293]